ncbi:SPFH domain-containing protein [Algisphaera agarilytica]|uniref:Protein HflC n=1 Tax=Algisphaera agarilytica TaxID=1385975 RepID=A0A7X0H5V5_9BACT|nr:SPFH domain-containing protein [Algisphaera agarilytica]MBB6429852.1 membrane protease subunit HflC [Algisphaera agarilytica]
MRKLTTLLIAAIICVVLVLYMFFFQVSFDERAVITTFAKAERPVYAEDGVTIVEANSLIIEPGIRPKLPWPIQKVYRYPTKVQLLEQELSQLQTADENSIVLKTYVTWRISDPYQFFVALQNVEQAKDRIGTQMQDLKGEFSNYRFDQMVNTDLDALALDEIESTITELLRQRIIDLDYGIDIEQVGIRRILFPEATTEKVFERMRSTRQRLAASAEQEGENQATAIRSEAERVKGQILSFANAEAERIKAEGIREGTKNYSLFAENPELAIFLSKVDTLKKTLPGSTLILDANAMQFMDLLITPESDASQEGGDE